MAKNIGKTFLVANQGTFGEQVMFSIFTSVACAHSPSVPSSSTDFSFQNLVFGNLFQFSAAKTTSKSISPTF